MYRTYEIKIYNSKTGKTEYRDYAITTKTEEQAFEAARAYAQSCVNRYRKGSTFTVEEI